MLKMIAVRSGTALSGLLVMSALLAPSAAHSQQILSAVESEKDGDGGLDKMVVTTAGALASTTLGGVDTRALTDFGVNKIYSTGNADFEQYATSAWLDSYTVGGAAGTMVDLTFNFSVDGLASFGSESEAEFNFKVYALRGTNWSMDSWGGGQDYDTIRLRQQRLDGGTTFANARDFDGFYNWAPGVDPESGANWASHAQLIGSGPTSYYSIESVSGFNTIERRLFATRFETYINGAFVAGQSGNYTDGTPLANAMNNSRNNVVANYSLLGVASMCAAADGCEAGTYPGTNLSLSFTLAAGSTFSLASIMTLDDLREGTIDLFNTAKVTGVSVSAGGSLTSQSGALGANGDGTYGYPAAAPAVPEPATWAMLIGGFALAGAVMRRRPVVAFAA